MTSAVQTGEAASLAARYRLRALDPLWFRGLGPAGNNWDPSVLHATALNYALVAALGFQAPHTLYGSVGGLWTIHSLPYPKLGLWMSPAELVPGTARPVQVFKGGRSGEKISVNVDKQGDSEALKATVGTVTFRLQPDAKGNFDLTFGDPGQTGKPYLTTGYFGEWEGVLLLQDPGVLDLFAEDEDEDEGGPEGNPGVGEARKIEMVLRLGPNRVPMELVIEPFQALKELPEPVDGRPYVLASHLVDPYLVHEDLTGEAIFAKPYPLGRVAPNRVGECDASLLVHSFKIR